MDKTQDTEERRFQLQAEAEAVLEDSSLRRSPTLSALLRYLVNETLAGRANDLKSYTIAVDGLGRSENFDPSSDSSARVQMIRLRKALESYYAKNAPSDRLCLYLQPGSYVIRIAIPSVAYPAMYRLKDDTVSRSPSKLTADQKRLLSPRPYPPSKPETVSEKGQAWLRKWPRSLGIAVGILISAVAFYAYQSVAKSSDIILSPVVSVAPIATGNDPQLMPLAELVRNAYETDLARFKIARIRIGTDTDSANEQPATYRLNTRMVAAGNSTATIYISLDESSTDTVIWTKSVALPTNPADAARPLVPLLIDIIGPAGAVALHQTSLTRHSNAGGYPCMMKYIEFIRTRNPALEAPLAHCLVEPVQEPRFAATVLGMRAMFEIERSDSRKNPKLAIKRGLVFARRAVAQNPRDSWANFAMATLSYFVKDCRSAVAYTTSTMEENPISPVFTAALASLAQSCNHPDADKILDQALLAQSPLYVRARLFLAFAALSQNRIDRLAEIRQSAPPETAGQQRFYHVSEAIIAAGNGNSEEATRHWRAFSAVSAQQARTADEKLAGIITFPEARRKVIEFLKKSGVRL